MSLKQLAWDRGYEFFVGRATLCHPSHFFVLSCGIPFTDGCDGLDYYRAALLEMEDSTKVVLRQYCGGNSSWTDICLDERLENADDIEKIVSSVMADLDVSPTHLVWQHPQGWINYPGKPPGEGPSG